MMLQEGVSKEIMEQYFNHQTNGMAQAAEQSIINIKKLIGLQQYDKCTYGGDESK